MATPGEFNAGGHLPRVPIPPPASISRPMLNHCAIRIHDPIKSLEFYVGLMGMRIVWTLNTGPFTIYWLGSPDEETDINRFVQDSQAGIRERPALELVHTHGAEDHIGISYSNGNEPPHLGFSHTGFTVDSVEETLERLAHAGVEIVKPIGQATRQQAGVSDWEVNQGIGVEELHPNYIPTFEQIAFVRDPEGYLVELVPRQFK